VRISEEDGSERGAKECEGRGRWMTGGGARMASREMGVARSYLDYGESQLCMLAYCNLTFVLGFKFQVVSL
jgi:hypothetical protein